MRIHGAFPRFALLGMNVRGTWRECDELRRRLLFV